MALHEDAPRINSNSFVVTLLVLEVHDKPGLVVTHSCFALLTQLAVNPASVSVQLFLPIYCSLIRVNRGASLSVNNLGIFSEVAICIRLFNYRRSKITNVH
jgi:hypothetical protein